MADPASRELLEQGAQGFDLGFPLAQMLSSLIGDALQGNVGRFEQMGLSKAKASRTRRAGARAQETTRRGLAARGLEQTGAGQAALTNLGMETDAAVLDAIFGEMGRYLNMAPQFALGLTGQAGQATAAASRSMAQSEANDPWGRILPSLLQAGGLAAGLTLGGPAGAALATGLGGMFGRMFQGGGPAATSPAGGAINTSMSPTFGIPPMDVT